MIQVNRILRSTVVVSMVFALCAMAMPLAGPAAAAAPLTWHALANGEYSIQLGESPQLVKLTNGVYTEKTAEDSALTNTVLMAAVYTIGDLNGDKVDDAAVVLAYNTGGSGVFHDLAAVLDVKGRSVHAASVPLGDRIILRTVTIHAGDAFVEMIEAGPNDPMCCPTQVASRVYRLSGKELAPAGKTPPPYLAWDALAHNEYATTAPQAGKIALKDGQSEGATPPIGLMDSYASGDLNGDGVADAAVVLMAGEAGSQQPVEVVTVLNEKGKAVPGAGVALDEGASVLGLSIVEGHVAVVTQAAGAAPVAHNYKLESGKLVGATGGAAVHREATLTEKDDGKTIEMAPGETLAVSLKGNPTTGYVWEADPAPDAAVLKQAGEAEYKPESDLVGAPGVQTLRFTAVGPGQAELKLVYHRPWETDVAPDQEFAVTVVVKGESAPAVAADHPEVALTEKDNGKTIEMVPGATLAVSLPGNPTTGYVWEANPAPDAAVLIQAGEAEYKPESDLVGAPGVQTMRFTVVGPGQAELKLVYYEPWEADVAPDEQFAVKVIVKGE